MGKSQFKFCSAFILLAQLIFNIYVFQKSDQPGLNAGVVEAVLCCSTPGGILSFFGCPEIHNIVGLIFWNMEHDLQIFCDNHNQTFIFSFFSAQWLFCFHQCATQQQHRLWKTCFSRSIILFFDIFYTTWTLTFSRHSSNIRVKHLKNI